MKTEEGIAYRQCWRVKIAYSRAHPDWLAASRDHWRKGHNLLDNATVLILLRPFWQNYPSFDGLNDLTKAIFTKSDSQTDSKQRCGMLLLFVVLIARTISRKE